MEEEESLREQGFPQTVVEGVREKKGRSASIVPDSED